MKPLVLQDVVKTFAQGGGAVTALQGIELSIEEGGFCAVMGASGSGKSTLLHLAAGLTRPDAGRILIRGELISEMPDRQLTRFRREHIGLVFQSFNLVPTLTAAENIALPLRLGGVRGPAVDRRVDQLIEKLHLTDRRDHRPDALSGGEQQRVAIARALVNGPAVVFADEPTGNLDSDNARTICQLLRELNEHEGVSVVMVTHEPSVAVYAREVVFIRDGRVVDRFASAESAGGNGDAVALAHRYQAMLTGSSAEREPEPAGDGAASPTSQPRE